MAKEIVVLNRGFIMVGEVSPDPDDFLQLKISNCAIIRRWGTTQGLGQLALEGPTSETVLDPEPDGYINKLAVIRRIPCKESKGWR